jgi:hypothetical protein
MSGLETLLLVNPRTRRAKVRRNPAAKANPRKRRVRRNPVGAYLAGNPSRRRRRGYRRNPIAARSGSTNIMSGAKGMMNPVMYGTIGALGVNVATNLIPIPDSLKVGITGSLTRSVVAVLLGTVGRKLLGAKATDMAIGSLIVTSTEAAQSMLAGMIPGLPAPGAAGLGYYAPGFNAMRPQLPQRVNAPTLRGWSTGPTAGSVQDGKFAGSKLSAYVR